MRVLCPLALGESLIHGRSCSRTCSSIMDQLGTVLDLMDSREYSLKSRGEDSRDSHEGSVELWLLEEVSFTGNCFRLIHQFLEECA